LKSSLKIALIHLDVKYKQPEENRRTLLALNREAADLGADLVLNTEMGISGYSFSSREDISKYTETETGETLSGVARIAKEYKAYIGIGFAERDKSTDIYYNSAFVLGPEGIPVCRYRKINGEMRWACPGSFHQEGTFDTPWGRIGILICSDSYYGLMPRSMALKGVDLLWIPANWPPTGLDPGELWKARVLENGFFLAACNRTGKDLRMNCQEACSCVYDPEGRVLFSDASPQSQIFLIDIPLDKNGKISGQQRRQHLANRNPAWYGSIYLDFRLVDDFTEHYDLPESGSLHVHCIVPDASPLNGPLLEKRIETFKSEGAHLFVLPHVDASVLSVETLDSLAKQQGVGICTALKTEQGDADYILATPDGSSKYPTSKRSGFDADQPFPMIHYGCAKIAMAPFEFFVHPELAVTFSKSGCDLVVLSEDILNKKMRLLAGIKTIEKIAVAVSAGNGAGIYMMPQGHQRWEERSIDGPGICSHAVDTSRLRKKNFQDRVDFELLLKNGVS